VDGKKTCETLWVASSHTGDYHDNMNANMFMQRVEDKLIPTFKVLYPGKRMILVADNAPYHHKREIDSLANTKKAQLVDLCHTHEVTYLDVPLSGARLQAYDDGETDTHDITDMGEYYRVDVHEDVEWLRATTKRSGRECFIPTVQEFRLAIVSWIKDNKPHLLVCQVERALHREGYQFLWTPPYCSELQPIELFWAAGKNYAASLCHNKIKMRETIKYLREGWYGNEDLWEDGSTNITQDGRRRPRKRPANCKGMVSKSLQIAEDKFIPIANGVTGTTLLTLQEDPDYEEATEDMPIDLVVNQVAPTADIGPVAVEDSSSSAESESSDDDEDDE